MNRWVRCKGCGKPLGLFIDGIHPYIPAGSVGHVKPEQHGMSCDLYRIHTSEELIAMHADAESIEPPEKMTPMLD
jgi:hypothetical protein